LSTRQKYSEPVVIIEANFHSGTYFDRTAVGSVTLVLGL
jgi:hypothetical protein